MKRLSVFFCIICTPLLALADSSGTLKATQIYYAGGSIIVTMSGPIGATCPNNTKVEIETSHSNLDKYLSIFLAAKISGSDMIIGFNGLDQCTSAGNVRLQYLSLN